MRLHVDAPAVPNPHALRAAIEARLAGGAWSGPEAVVGDRVREAVGAAAARRAEGRRPTEGRPWR
jgi:hypothetical protein